MISAGLVTHKGTLPILFYDPCVRKEGFRLDTKKNIFNLNILKQRQQSGESSWLLSMGLALTAAVLESRRGKAFHHYVFSLMKSGNLSPTFQRSKHSPREGKHFTEGHTVQ